jgi:hypothetical protein
MYKVVLKTMLALIFVVHKQFVDIQLIGLASSSEN